MSHQRGTWITGTLVKSLHDRKLAIQTKILSLLVMTNGGEFSIIIIANMLQGKLRRGGDFKVSIVHYILLGQV